MSVQEIISFALKASLFGLVLSVGLQSRWSDFTYVLRRPALLLRAILAVHVVVPAIVIGLCLLLPIASWTKAGLVMMAVSPLAPLAPIKMLKGAAREYAVGTTFALMLVATVAVPLTAEALRPLTTNHVKIPLTMVTLIVGTTVLLPLAIGVLAHGEWETFSERLAPFLRKAALAIIIPIALLILVRFWRQFVPLLGDGTLAVIAVAAASGLWLCLGRSGSGEPQSLGRSRRDPASGPCRCHSAAAFERSADTRGDPPVHVCVGRFFAGIWRVLLPRRGPFIPVR